jgi:UDP-N-acetyl-D-glucosamine dehydrogenase
MEKLEDMGARVSYNDPHIPVIRPTREFARFAGRKSVKVTGNYDLILIVTAHEEYLKGDIVKFGIPIVDTRNLIRMRSKLVYRA